MAQNSRTPESLKAQIAAARLLQQGAASNGGPYTSGGVTALKAISGLMGGLAERQALQADQDAQAQSNATLARALMAYGGQRSGEAPSYAGAPASGGGAASVGPSSSRIGSDAVASGTARNPGGYDRNAAEAMIRARAPAYGIDPDTAVRIARSEGLNVYQGDGGSSFGPFQLHYGGVAKGGNSVGGLGDAFTRQTGLDARDPTTVAQQIDFALSQAAKGGWGPWHGRQTAGIGIWDGIGRGGGATSTARADAPAPGAQPVASDTLPPGVSPDMVSGGSRGRAPFFVGDSLAQGLQQAARGEGDAAVGRSPAAVLAAIDAVDPASLQGRDVVLSSGASNDPSRAGMLRDQIAALQAKGVDPSRIRVVGVGGRPDFAGINDQLGQIAAQSGATFGGPVSAGRDGVHPADYGAALRRLAGGADLPAQNAQAAGMAGLPPGVTPAMFAASQGLGADLHRFDEVPAGTRPYVPGSAPGPAQSSSVMARALAAYKPDLGRAEPAVVPDPVLASAAPAPPAPSVLPTSLRLPTGDVAGPPVVPPPKGSLDAVATRAMKQAGYDVSGLPGADLVGAGLAAGKDVALDPIVPDPVGTMAPPPPSSPNGALVGGQGDAALGNDAGPLGAPPPPPSPLPSAPPMPPPGAQTLQAPADAASAAAAAGAPPFDPEGTGPTNYPHGSNPDMRKALASLLGAGGPTPATSAPAAPGGSPPLPIDFGSNPPPMGGPFPDVRGAAPPAPSGPPAGGLPLLAQAGAPMPAPAQPGSGAALPSDPPLPPVRPAGLGGPGLPASPPLPPPRPSDAALGLNSSAPAPGAAQAGPQTVPASVMAGALAPQTFGGSGTDAPAGNSSVVDPSSPQNFQRQEAARAGGMSASALGRLVGGAAPSAAPPSGSGPLDMLGGLGGMLGTGSSPGQGGSLGSLFGGLMGGAQPSPAASPPTPAGASRLLPTPQGGPGAGLAPAQDASPMSNPAIQAALIDPRISDSVKLKLMEPQKHSYSIAPNGQMFDTETGRLAGGNFEKPAQQQSIVVGDKAYSFNPSTGKYEEQIASGAATPTGEQKDYATIVKQAQDAGQTPPGYFDYQKALKAAGKTEVTVDNRAENAEAQARGAGLGKRLNDVADDAAKVQAEGVQVARIRDLLTGVDTGPGTTYAEKFRQATGVALDRNTDKVQALNAAIQNLAPSLRTPGSGAQSDVELRNFQASIPGLLNTPGGNEQILRTLEGAIQYRQSRSAIAQAWQRGEITAAQADQQMMAVPSPFASRSAAPGGSAQGGGPDAPHNVAPGVTGAPVAVQTPDQARALPPGTLFTTPDGRTMRR